MLEIPRNMNDDLKKWICDMVKESWEKYTELT